MDKEAGMISISMLIILSIMTVFSLYIYKLSIIENDSLEILRKNIQTQNYTISESLDLINIYKNDKEKWKDDCLNTEGKNNFDDAIIIDEKIILDEYIKKPVQIKAYLLQMDNKTLYKLVVESNIDDITSQNCVYLQRKPMIVLYSVGNVKEQLKRIGKKLYIRNLSKFIFIYLDEDNIFLMTLKNINKIRWQISHFYMEKIQEKDEDINFYQEVLYRFYKEQEQEEIKYLVISIAKQKLQILNYNFPMMPLAEVKKALYWELQEDINLKKYYYTYILENIREGYSIKVNLIIRNIVNLWQQLAKEQNLKLYSVFCQNDVNIDMIIEDEYVKKYVVGKNNDSLNCELQIDRELLMEIENFDVISEVLVCFLKQEYQEFLPKKQQLSYFNWKNIYLLLITIILSCSCCLSGYVVTKYYQAERQEQNIKEEINLVQNDIDDIEQLKQQENLIKDKQKLVQILEEKSVNMYAILINLGANTVDDVHLVDMKIENGEVFLKGRAKNYQSIAMYKEKLSSINFFHTNEIGEIKINTEDNLLDFTMKIVMR